jgi:hypothetical protein
LDLLKRLALIAYAIAATLFAVIAGAIGASPRGSITHTVFKPVAVQVGQENLYIRNLDQADISDAQILRDIPAWEQAVNVDFASYWHTTRFHLVFIGREPAPIGQMSAVFVKKGPVKGALAYHTIGGNAPAITVYSGTGNYYGYDNSVSFTHELFELAADPVTSYLNIGYPIDYYWLQKPNGDLKQEYSSALAWFSEVSDPVEADWYSINGVKISDFVTPAWFGDGVGERFDFMGLCQQPLWIRPGGYAIYLGPSGFDWITNFRANHPEDRGFYVGDRDLHD